MYFYHVTEGLAHLNGFSSGYGKDAVTSETVKALLDKSPARYVMATSSTGRNDSKMLLEAGFRPLGSRNNPVYGIDGKHMVTLWLLERPSRSVSLKDFALLKGAEGAAAEGNRYSTSITGGPYPFWTHASVKREHDARPLLEVPTWVRHMHCCGVDFLWARDRGLPLPLPNPTANFTKSAFIYVSPAMRKAEVEELRRQGYEQAFGRWAKGHSGWVHIGPVAIEPDAEKLRIKLGI